MFNTTFKKKLEQLCFFSEKCMIISNEMQDFTEK